MAIELRLRLARGYPNLTPVGVRGKWHLPFLVETPDAVAVERKKNNIFLVVIFTSFVLFMFGGKAPF
jgi:hypothetical protein